MKYAIVQTWNGEGYSYANTAEIKEFKNDTEANTYLHELLKVQANAEILDISMSHISFEIGDDQGSFRFIKDAEKLYGLMIHTNENEVHPLLNKTNWRDKIAFAISQSDPEEVEELDLTELSIFISSYDADYDYQFIRF